MCVYFYIYTSARHQVVTHASVPILIELIPCHLIIRRVCTIPCYMFAVFTSICTYTRVLADLWVGISVDAV